MDSIVGIDPANNIFKTKEIMKKKVNAVSINIAVEIMKDMMAYLT